MVQWVVQRRRTKHKTKKYFWCSNIFIILDTETSSLRVDCFLFRKKKVFFSWLFFCCCLLLCFCHSFELKTNLFIFHSRPLSIRCMHTTHNDMPEMRDTAWLVLNFEMWSKNDRNMVLSSLSFIWFVYVRVCRFFGGILYWYLHKSTESFMSFTYIKLYVYKEVACTAEYICMSTPLFRYNLRLDEFFRSMWYEF